MCILLELSCKKFLTSKEIWGYTFVSPLHVMLVSVSEHENTDFRLGLVRNLLADNELGEFSLFYTQISVHVFMEHFIIQPALFVYISACSPKFTTIDFHQPTVRCWNLLCKNTNLSCRWFFGMVFEPAIEQFVKIAIVTSLALVVEDTLVFALLEFLSIRHYCDE